VCECFSVSNLCRVPPALHGSTLTPYFLQAMPQMFV